MRRGRGGKDGGTRGGEQGPLVESLLNEVRMLFHRAVQVAEELHSEEEVSLGMRAVLEFLLREGPATVPEIARRRFVTRQHIQTLANAVVERGLATLEPNPAHRRSRLVALTPAGRALIERMRRRELQLYVRTDFEVTGEAMRQAARTLARVRKGLGGVE
jgi:DNA-binding MarR family transcriptional regulator